MDRKINFKDFLYLDTDYLNSFLAQNNDGLPENSSTEITDNNEKVEENTNKKTPKLGVELNTIFVKASMGLDENEIKTSIRESEAAKEIVNKKLHDNAYTYFDNYITENKLINDSTQCEIGKYIKLTDKIKCLDLSIFSDDFLKVLEWALKKEEQKSKENLNSMQEGTAKVLAKNKIKNIVPNNMNDVKNSLDAFSLILPSKTIVSINNFIFFLNDKHKRMDFKGLDYLYSENISVVGQITKKGFLTDIFPNNEEKEIVVNLLGNLKNKVFPLLVDMLGFSKDNCYMIKPIAIYFGS